MLQNTPSAPLDVQSLGLKFAILAVCQLKLYLHVDKHRKQLLFKLKNISMHTKIVFN